MKISKYNWEDKYMLNKFSKTVLNFDIFNTTNLIYDLNIKLNLNTTKNIDFAKILTFNIVFSPQKSFIYTKENVDKNPLKLKITNKKNLNTSIRLISNNYKDSVFYIYYAYLYNLFKNKNIFFNSNVNTTHNINIKEINSILKIGHSYNVLDIDPVVELNFSKIKNVNLMKTLINK